MNPKERLDHAKEMLGPTDTTCGDPGKTMTGLMMMHNAASVGRMLYYIETGRVQTAELSLEDIRRLEGKMQNKSQYIEKL